MRKNLFFKHCFAFLSGLITSLQEKNGRGGGSRTRDILLPKQAR